MHRRIWRLAGPIIISNVSVPLLGAVDTAVVGHLPGPQYLGSVAIGALIFSFLYWGFGFLRMGTTGLTAQAVGASEPGAQRLILYRALVLGAAIALLILVLQALIAWAAFRLIDASAAVETLADVYFSIRIWGAPATLANYAILGWFLGLQNARIPLALQVFTNGVNILLDLWFVLGLGWGVAGVAGATVLAEFAGLGLGIAFVVSRLRRRGEVRIGWRRVFDGREIGRMMVINLDIFIRTLCLIFAFAYWTAQSARLGDTILAVNAVLANFNTFAAYGLDGFAHAAEALVGRAKGAGDRAAFARAARVSMLWAGLFAALFALFYWLAGDLIIALMTDLAEVRHLAADYLPWAIVLPLVSVWAFAYDGIFIGATRTRALRNGMLISLILYLAAANVGLSVWGNHGLWAALVVFMALRAGTLGLQYPSLLRSIGAARAGAPSTA